MFKMRINTFYFLILLSGISGMAEAPQRGASPSFNALSDSIPEEMVDDRLDIASVSMLIDTKGGVLDREGASTNQVNSRVEFLVSVGFDYANEGEYEEAERDYMWALKKKPENRELLFRLSTLYTMMERFDDAIVILQKQIELDPEASGLHNNLSWCYSTGQSVFNPEKALSHAREALLISPYNPSVWNTLAEAYYVSGGYEKALRSSTHAIGLLSGLDIPEEQIKSYELQKEKIIRALDAMNIFEELSEGGALF